MEHLSSYPSIYAIGHKAIQELFSGPVIVEEKIDGSQFSFGLLNGELVCRSKGKQLILDAPEKMFEKAVKTARSLAPSLVPDWIYRGEFLEKPKHNTLAYDRVPCGNIVIFDINTGLEEYMSWEDKAVECERLCLECVSRIFEGKVDDFATFKDFLELNSMLGGTKIEGVVIKNYALFTQEKKVAMGKYVSEAFKEIHEKDWKERNPVGKDLVQMLIDKYACEARWRKGVQHLSEAGTLTNSPQDIGPLMKEIPEDIKKECTDEIKKALFDHFWPAIARGTTKGIPEWYKDLLAKSAFEET